MSVLVLCLLIAALLAIRVPVAFAFFGLDSYFNPDPQSAPVAEVALDWQPPAVAAQSERPVVVRVSMGRGFSGVAGQRRGGAHGCGSCGRGSSPGGSTPSCTASWGPTACSSGRAASL